MKKNNAKKKKKCLLECKETRKKKPTNQTNKGKRQYRLTRAGNQKLHAGKTNQLNDVSVKTFCVYITSRLVETHASYLQHQQKSCNGNTVSTHQMDTSPNVSRL
mgnify:CR=1 FL=1